MHWWWEDFRMPEIINWQLRVLERSSGRVWLIRPRYEPSCSASKKKSSNNKKLVNSFSGQWVNQVYPLRSQIHIDKTYNLTTRYCANEYMIFRDMMYSNMCYVFSLWVSVVFTPWDPQSLNGVPWANQPWQTHCIQSSKLCKCAKYGTQC
jgi:hypothetical protein